MDGRSAKAIFNAALERSGEERAAFVARSCAGDAALRAEVEGLLRAHEEAGGFLEAPTAAGPGAGKGPGAAGGGGAGAGYEGAAPIGEQPGDHIGRYRLLQLIGEGGFGSVFMAEQETPVRRRVALKIIKLGMDTREVIARFEQERQALAIMDHANIATVFDAGATSAGRPYFVMELVRGDPITVYCDRNNLGLGERLDLFERVCEAVQHAHTKGVIHRDLKPSNVLVTVVDGRAVPKVIDFGIAKATSARLTEKTLFTEHRALIGTPEYMSPEQADPSGTDVDTRSDIYSLGVLLYELLTGTTPFEGKSLRSAALAEIQRIIREEEPPKPSTRLSGLESLPSVAAQRREQPARLSRLIRGDLDWIVMKCLEKDRSRRYSTASGLALDLRRHSAGEPVTAAPPSAAYRARKFMRRHRVGVAAGAATGAALLAGTVGTSVGMLRALAAEEEQARLRVRAEAGEQSARDEAERATRAEGEATQRAAELSQVAEFQAAQLSGVDARTMGVRLRSAIIEARRAASAAKGEDEEAVREAASELERSLAGVNFTDIALGALEENIFTGALEAVDERFSAQPLVRAHLLQTLADTLRTVGLWERAAAPQEEALAIRRRELGPEHPDTLTSLNSFAGLVESRGGLAEAEPLYREALEARARVLGPEDPMTLTARNNLGLVLRKLGRLEEAEPHLVEALEGRRRVLGEDHEHTLSSLNNVGLVLMARGKLSEAEPYRRESLERSRRVLGEDHPYAINALGNMGALLEAQGRLAEAEPLRVETLERLRRVLGDDHPDTLAAVNNLAGLWYAQGRLAEAEPLFRTTLETRRRLLGSEHPSVLVSINNLAAVIQKQGRLSEAEPLMREALRLRREALGEDHPHTLGSLNNLGALLRAQGRLPEAEACSREAMERQRRTLGDDHPSTLGSSHNLAGVLREMGRLEEAERLGRETVTRGRTALGAEHPKLGAFLSDQGATLIALKRFSEAEEALLAAYAIVEKTAGEGEEQVRAAAEKLADLYDAWRSAEPAVDLDLKAVEWRGRASRPE